MDRYVRGNLIARGAYGEVFMGTHNASGSRVAMKSVRYESRQEGIPTTTMREVALLRHLNHDNIVDLRDVFCGNDEKLWLIFEYMNMDLRKYMDDTHEPHGIVFDVKRSLMMQCLTGVEFCHNRGIMHRDLKPQNLLISLVNGETILKVADFGLARTLSSSIYQAEYTSEVVTRWYRCPEILLGDANYSTAVDIWSCAVIMMELLDEEHKPLLDGSCEIDQLHKIFHLRGTAREGDWPGLKELKHYRGNFPQWPRLPLISKIEVNGEEEAIVRSAVDLCDTMMAMDPNQRPNASDCIVALSGIV